MSRTILVNRDELTITQVLKHVNEPIITKEHCIDCLELYANFLLDEVENKYPSTDLLDSYINQRKKCLQKEKKTHKGNGSYAGPFAFTITKSPQDPLTEDHMIVAVKKIMSQKSCPVVKYAWYLEHKENGTHPHIHGMYETTTMGRIEAKHFKRAWPIWDEKSPMGAGFRGGYHRPVRHQECYDDYIKKDGGLSESSTLN